MPGLPADFIHPLAPVCDVPGQQDEARIVPFFDRLARNRQFEPYPALRQLHGVLMPLGLPVLVRFVQRQHDFAGGFGRQDLGGTFSDQRERRRRKQIFAPAVQTVNQPVQPHFKKQVRNGIQRSLQLILHGRNDPGLLKPLRHVTKQRM